MKVLDLKYFILKDQLANIFRLIRSQKQRFDAKNLIPLEGKDKLSLEKLQVEKDQLLAQSTKHGGG